MVIDALKMYFKLLTSSTSTLHKIKEGASYDDYDNALYVCMTSVL